MKITRRIVSRSPNGFLDDILSETVTSGCVSLKCIQSVWTTRFRSSCTFLASDPILKVCKKITIRKSKTSQHCYFEK
jgi:hypothetical protein